MNQKHECSENICFLSNGSERHCHAYLNIRRAGIHAKCLGKQEHMKGVLQTVTVHIWQTEAWKAAKGSAYNGLTSTHPEGCCFTSGKI